MNSSLTVGIKVSESRVEVGRVWKEAPQRGQVEQGHCLHPGAGTPEEEPFPGGE